MLSLRQRGYAGRHSSRRERGCPRERLLEGVSKQGYKNAHASHVQSLLLPTLTHGIPGCSFHPGSHRAAPGLSFPTLGHTGHCRQ